MKTTTSQGTPPTDAELRRDAVALRDALAGLVRVCGFADRGTICCHDVSVTQCYAVDALVRRGPMTLNQLAAEIYLDKTTASRVVATLERKKYAARTANAQDRRSIQLRATAAGRRLIEAIHGEQVAELTQLLAAIEPGTRAAATQLVVRLTQAVAGRCGGGGEAAECSPGCAPEPCARGKSC